MKRFLAVFLILIQCLSSNPVFAKEMQTGVDFYNSLNEIVDMAMSRSNTPGVAVAVVSEDGIWTDGYGYADEAEEIMVTNDTLFELGSMSKAFTALGILYLEHENKLCLDDEVKEYLPWLSLIYKGEYKGQRVDGEVPVTLKNLLYHTSGIPFETIGYIPEGNSDDMLESTVRNLIGVELDFYPGQKYSYATINYDILGLVIEVITGNCFEDFIMEKICKPLGLSHTYLYRQEAQETGHLAKGYKTGFFQAWEYDAPEYRGNTPAGYVISSIDDMARWMQIQMGMIDVPEPYAELIARSHISDRTVTAVDDYSYAAGWNVHIRGEYLTHGGSNPNYSSMMMINMEQKTGICVLTNLNSSAPGYICDNFFHALFRESYVKYERDIYQLMDGVFSLLLLILSLLGIVFAILLMHAVIDIISRKRSRQKFKKVNVAGIVPAVPILCFYGYCIYYLPNILFGRLPWMAVAVWGSRSIPLGSIVAYLAGIIFFLYVVLTYDYPKSKEKNYITLIPLSVLNGLASALIIFTINESFNRNLEYSKELLVYFLFALTFFVYTIKLTQGRMIVIANEIVFEKRIAIIDRILQASYQSIEKIGSARIYSSLNNDASAVSKLPGTIVSIASNILTLIFCLGYLLSNSPAAFAASTTVIILNCFISYLTGRLASRYWEKNRDVQDIYFSQLSDLVYGFKELILSSLRKMEFGKEIRSYSRYSAELSKEASIKFLNFGLYNTLMYNIIFGVVVFVFPIIIYGINVNDLRENLFLVFYLIGPFGNLMGAIPNLTEVKVNMQRINQLICDLGTENTENSLPIDHTKSHSGELVLQLNKVIFKYESEKHEEDEFVLGPIEEEIRTGEITFIIGGNGSGKSTLGKILAGLYSPVSGTVSINGDPCSVRDLNDCFAAVYSDFYLFSKFYGIEYQARKEEIHHMLKHMKLEDKVEIDENGKFVDIKLSTGQRKRLAFIVCCLDDKPFMLFDEWAAEQDPEFRTYFYMEILPKMKEKGKGIIVITHDDRFFHLADRIIKLERGKLVQ